MSPSKEITILKKDYENICALVANIDNPTAVLLEEELDRADVVDVISEVNTIVSMGSVVSFVDELSDQELTLKLLYPKDMQKKIEHQKVSILAPIGAALIGLRVGQTIEWPLPNGKIKHLKVTSVFNESP